MWYRRSLSVKLLGTIAAALFLPLVLTIVWTGSELSKTMFGLTEDLYASALGHAADNLNTEMEYIRSISDSYSFDQLLLAYLYDDYQVERPVDMLLEAHSYIRNKLTAPTMGFGALHKAVLYVNNPGLWISGGYLYSIAELDPDIVGQIAKAGNAGWWTDASTPLLHKTSRFTYLLTNSIPVVTYNRFLYDSFAAGRALLSLQLPLSRLSQYLPGLPGISYLINRDGMTLAASGGEHTSPAYYPHFDKVREQGGPFEENGGGSGMLISALRLNNGWMLVNEMPRDRLFANVDKVRDLSLRIALTIGAVACCIMLVLWRTVLRRIKLLVQKIERFARGDLSLSGQPAAGPSRDEMEMLSVRLDQMAGQLETLIHENYELGIKRKNSELRALQAQINPHFLYNTLSTIKWMTLAHSGEEIREITDAIARFYRISLNRGRDIIRVSEEIECTKAYLAIQHFRTSGRIQVHWQIGEEALEYTIPKLVLQPIVENALLHAPTDPQPMTILISVGLKDGILVLSVTDDGRGISEEKLRALLEGRSAENPSMGYGLNNVCQRLELYFGESISLDIHSKSGQGTSVRLFLPAAPSGTLAEG